MGSAVYLVAPNGFQDLILSIAMDAEYLSYVKFIATRAPTFFGYTISVLASVVYLDLKHNVPHQDI